MRVDTATGHSVEISLVAPSGQGVPAKCVLSTKLATCEMTRQRQQRFRLFTMPNVMSFVGNWI